MPGEIPKSLVLPEVDKIEDPIIREVLEQFATLLEENHQYYYENARLKIVNIPDGDTSPDVSHGMVFKTANTGATTITTFDNGYPGQKIAIIFGDTNTTVAETDNIILKGSYTSTADDVLRLVYDGTSWREISRVIDASNIHAQNTDADLDPTFEATFVKKTDIVSVLSDITSPGANIEDTVTKKHTQNTDHKIIDADSDSYEDVEKTADVDEAVTYLKDVLVRKFHDDGILDLPKQSRCRAHRSTSQVIATGTATKAQLNGEDWDNQNEFDSITNFRFTAKKAGPYQVNSSIWIQDFPDAKEINIDFYRNGGRVSNNIYTSGKVGTQGPSLSDVIYLGTNDYIELFVTQASGADKNLYQGSAFTFMSIHKLS